MQARGWCFANYKIETRTIVDGGRDESKVVILVVECSEQVACNPMTSTSTLASEAVRDDVIIPESKT